MSAAILQTVSSGTPSDTSSDGLSTESSFGARGRRISKSVLAGRIISGIAVAFLAFDAGMKLLRVKEAVDGTVQLGFSPSVMLPLGLIQVAGLVLYLFPRTAALGALLLTGYLGGAVAIHVRLGNPVFTHILFPIYVAIFLWVGLFLRDARVRATLQSRSN